MSSILVDFEVLPEDGPADRSATQVCGDLRRQLGDPGSVLRAGDFGRFAAHASLSGPADASRLGGLPNTEEYDAGREHLPRAASSRGDVSDSVFPGGGCVGSAGHFGGGQPGPHWNGAPYETPVDAHPRRLQSFPGAAADWHGGHNIYEGSNTELVDRISQLELQISQTAVGNRPAEDPTTPLPRRSIEVEALEKKCHHLQQRTEAAERELRDAQESSQSYRRIAEQSEMKLKEQKQRSQHAKEMWMKETVRASRLADALTSAENKLADQDRRLAETIERYERAQQEVRQLQHLLEEPQVPGRSGGGGAGGGFSGSEQWGGSKGNLANGAPKAQNFDSSLGDEIMGDIARGRPPSVRSLTAADAGRGAHSFDTSAEAETNADRFRRLCLLNDAILYEDELLQVGIKSEYSGKEGQILVYFGNKGSAALQAFTVQYFVREDQALRLTAAPLNQQVEADAQVVQRVGVTLVEPFVEPPWLRVQFLLPDASPRRIQTRFPVILTKFMLGRELSPAGFFQIWRQHAFVLNEVASIVHLATRLSGALVHVARSLILGGALRLHHGVDDNPDNLVLVGQVVDHQSSHNDRDAVRDHRGNYGEAADEGRRHADRDERDHFLSLVRVEIGIGKFAGKARVVVRSGSHNVARAVCEGVVGQLVEAGVPSSSGGVIAR